VLSNILNSHNYYSNNFVIFIAKSLQFMLYKFNFYKTIFNF
jgi:hypothetical protein